MPVLLLSLAGCLLFAGCVYFNRFYNARKFFKQAEKKRKEVEEQLDPRVSDRAYKSLYRQAVKKAASVVAFHPNSDWVDDSLLLMGQGFYWQEEYDKALRKFTELEENFPDSPFLTEARYWKGLCLWTQQKYDAAAAAFKALAKQKRLSLADNASYAVAEMAFEQEQYLVAIREYERTFAEFEKTELKADIWSRIGESNLALKRYAQALEAFEKALKYDPSTKTEYGIKLNIGQCLEAQEKYGEALQIYSDLFREKKFRSYQGQIHLRIADCYREMGEIETALEDYQSIIDRFPRSEPAAMAIYRKGVLYQAHFGDLKKAKELFEEAIKGSPNREIRELVKSKGRDISALEKYQAKITKLDSLLAAEGKDDSLAVSTDDSSKVSEQSGEERKERPGKAGKQAGKLAETYFLMAELYLFRLEQPDSALHAYGAVLERFPEDGLAPKAAYAIAWTKQEVLADSMGARADFERLIAKYPDTPYAQEAQDRLGLSTGKTDEELAREAFIQAEILRLEEGTPEAYLDLLEELADRYPKTSYAPKALYLMAWTYENVVGDSLAAEGRYKDLVAQFADSEFGEIARKWVKLTEKQRKKKKEKKKRRPKKKARAEEEIALADTAGVGEVAEGETSGRKISKEKRDQVRSAEKKTVQAQKDPTPRDRQNADAASDSATGGRFGAALDSLKVSGVSTTSVDTLVR